MDIIIVILVLFIVLLLMASAFFSGSETALTAASEARMRSRSRRGESRARTVEKLLQRKDKLISSLLIGNNLVNVVATSVATSLAITLLGESGVVVASLTMTVILVIFAEVIPKTYAVNNADRFAILVSRIVRVVVVLLTPLSWGLDHIVRPVTKRNKNEEGSREEELRGMIHIHGANARDADAKEQYTMLASILDLGELTVDEVMTHRGSVEMIDAESTPEDALRQVMKSPYTRHPVYSGRPENIVGVLHVKALLRSVNEVADEDAENQSDLINIAHTANPPYFVPQNALLIHQLQAFKNRREHFAIVVDEYGDFRGVVTLEDILEEIVGEIDDEHDITLPGLLQQDDGSWIVEGYVTIRELNRALNWELPDDDAATIAGLILNETRTIPAPGQEFRFHDTRFRVLQRERNKIEQIRVWRETREKTA
jgi:Mg2+/Co2+ transporter CorB